MSCLLSDILFVLL